MREQDSIPNTLRIKSPALSANNNQPQNPIEEERREQIIDNQNNQIGTD